MESCIECGSALPARAATGRPTLYCSTGCRRSRQYARARAARAVEAAERALLDAEQDVAHDFFFLRRAHIRKQ